VSKRRTFIGLLNTLKAQQGVLEHKFPRGHLYPFEERKGTKTLEVRAKENLRMDITVMCRDPARSTEVGKAF